MNPFEIAGQLSTTTTDNWDEIGEKEYTSFMVNRTFSYHLDTIMLANEMNMRHNADKRWQYDFLRLGINPKKKRFAKWAKPESNAEIELIMEVFNINRQKAISTRSLLSSDDINTLKIKNEHGGRK